MTVTELIEELQYYPPDALVILQKDAEGNGYSPLSGTDPYAIYIADSTWSGEVYDTRWTSEDAGLEDEEWEEMKAENPTCVILFPVN